MYGEKVEEADELRLDLQDVKEMYKLQVSHVHVFKKSQGCTIIYCTNSRDVFYFTCCSRYSIVQVTGILSFVLVKVMKSFIKVASACRLFTLMYEN